jgi:hypothetical protein
MNSSLFSDTTGYQRRVERISQTVVRVHGGANDSVFTSVRGLILEWLRHQAGYELPKAMLRGETDSLDPLGAQRVETVAIETDGLWAARLDYQDRSVARRTWVAEAMLAATGPRAALLGFRLHCVTLGEPAPFSRSIPRFMRATGRIHEVHLDGVEIDLTSTPVETEEETDALVQLILSPERRNPVVGVSMDESWSGEPREFLNSDALANAVFGTAHVRLLSRDASFWLTKKIGKRFSVFNGAVRIWWPNLNLEQEAPYDHPLWLAGRIRDEGETPTLYSISDRILRAAAGRRDADNAIPSFAEVRRAASTLERKVAAQSGQSDASLIPLYEAENARILDELREAKIEQAELLAIADEDVARIRADRDAACAEIFMAPAVGSGDHHP